MAKITPLADILDRQYYNKNNARSYLGSCTGCGGGTVVEAIARAIDRIGLKRKDVVLVTGIGCSGGQLRCLNYSVLQVLHGRASACATGLKVARPDLTVISLQGDGDAIAIGGNHFIHACRRNIDITIVVNNNFTYGRTGGQFGPTTPPGSLSTSAPYGTIEPPMDACKLAETAGATFVARATTYHITELIDLIEKGILHHGCSVVESITQCPTSYGRYNPEKVGKNAPEMLRWMRDNAVRVEKSKEMSEEDMRGKFPIGLFVDRQAPEYNDEYDKIIALAQKQEQET